jgi:3-dehydroquinate synthetase/shikimate kinase
MAAVTQTGGPIVFTGFMAAGKSEAGRAAAEALGAPFLDADVLLEERLGEPIADFFAREGEEAFRAHESELVRKLLGHREAVVALGGGAIENQELPGLLSGAVTAWCQVSEEDAWERAQAQGGRPLAGDREEFSRRYSERLPLYEQAATAVLPEGGAAAGAEAAPWLAALRGKSGMRLAWARSASGSYPAVVGPGAISLVAEVDPDRRRFAIADREVFTRHADLLPELEAVIQLEGGEERKTLTEAEVLLRALAEMHARRDDVVLAFGGGVTGDIAGFVAATYQRGTPVIQLPTTVVAQVDSAYGGKTGVDLPAGKNYVGAYHQPVAVLADPETLATLPPQEIAAGFVEVLKTGLLAGGPLWELVRDIDFIGLVTASDDQSAAMLAEIVFACARTKIEVVASDERDGGRRAVLNLGHTVGHAIETVTEYRRYRHGEAIGLGLLAALRLSGADDLRQQVRSALEAHGLPTALDSSVSTDEVIEATAHDKKATREGIGFVLLAEPGEPRWGQQVDPASLRSAVSELHA